MDGENPDTRTAEAKAPERPEGGGPARGSGDGDCVGDPLATGEGSEAREQARQVAKGSPAGPWLRLSLRAGALAVLVSVAVLLVTFEEETWDLLAGLEWDFALGLGSLVLVAWSCGATRLMILASGLDHRLGFVRSVAATLSSEFGVTVTPAGAGGAALWLGVLRSYGVPLSDGAALLTAEVAIDILVFLFLVPFALVALIHRPALMDRMSEGMDGGWLVIPLAAIVLVAVVAWALARWSALEPVRRGLWSIRPLRRVGVRLARLWRRRHHFLHQMRSGLHTLFRLKPGLVALAVVLAVVQWTCRYSILPLLVFHFGGSGNALILFLIQGLLLALSYVIVAPGGGGGVEVVSLLVLRLFAPVAAVGVVVVLWRFFTYHLYMLGGGMTFGLTLLRRRRGED